MAYPMMEVNIETSLASISLGLYPHCAAMCDMAKAPAHGSTNRVYPCLRAFSISGFRNFCS